MRATVQLSVLYPPGLPYIEGYTEGETIKRGQTVSLYIAIYYVNQWKPCEGIDEKH